MTIDLKIGDPWPFASSRGLTGRPCEPVWHALITAPQQEAKAAHRLEAAGAVVQYPTEERIRHRHGKKHTRTVPMMPRIIYVEFSYEPQWDVMRTRKVIMGVFCQRGNPVALNEDDIARVMGMPTEAERLAAEQIAEFQPVVGERAKLTDGPFADFYVDVVKVEGGRVWYQFMTGVGLVKGEDTQGVVQRIAV